MIKDAVTRARGAEQCWDAQALRSAMPVPDYTIETIESMPFSENSYILWRQGRSDAVVVDPGFDAESIIELLDRHGLHLAAILNTHGHADHIAGNEAMKEAFPAAPLVIGRNEAAHLRDPSLNMSGSFGVPLVSPEADRLVADGERIEFGGFAFEVREIPGHSPGSVVFVCEEFDPPFVLGGDVLFAGSIGRTDMGGSMPRLLHGIRTKLFPLPDKTLVYSGHGPVTTIGAEKKTNPFVGEPAGFHDSR
jgi:glyoxylase-like metal-dependent hydrolase (beta-lactamase superfamily II)